MKCWLEKKGISLWKGTRTKGLEVFDITHKILTILRNSSSCGTAKNLTGLSSVTGRNGEGQVAAGKYSTSVGPSSSLSFPVFFFDVVLFFSCGE